MSSEKRWTLEKWGANPLAVAVHGPETEKVEVIPADSPNVLSVEEARLVCKALVTAKMFVEREPAAAALEALRGRLSTFAEKTEEGDRA